MPLTSPQNPLLQKIRRAVIAGRATEDGLIAIEGPHLLAEAMQSLWGVEQIVCSTTGFERHQALLSNTSLEQIPLVQVADRAFETVKGTEHTQGIVALLRPRSFTSVELLLAPGPLVILDNIQDPGNAGTILRSTEAFSGCGVILTQGCVKVANGKLQRAAAGSIFRLPFMENTPVTEIIRTLKAARRSLFSLTADSSRFLSSISLKDRVALVVGSEGRGVSNLFIEASQPISIYTRGVESLNAATACSIALYEAARQTGLQ